MLLAGGGELFAAMAPLLRARGLRAVEMGGDASLRQAVRAANPGVVVLAADGAGEPVRALCGWLRSVSTAGLIVIAGSGQAVDRVVALESGADSVLEPPVEPRELLARIRALLRRPAAGLLAPPAELAGPGERTVAIGGCRFECEAQRLFDRTGQEIRLSARELALLSIFVERPRRVLSRGQLAQMMGCEADGTESRAVDAAINRLRRKLEADPLQPLLIVTVKGEGYRFEPAHSADCRG